MPVVEHAVIAYKIWHEYRKDFPQGLRYTLGQKIDSTFITILEYLFVAGYQNKIEKLPTIAMAIRKLDLLKFFLRIAWEFQALDNKRYITISEKLDDLGRMVGGWKRGLESKTPSA